MFNIQEYCTNVEAELGLWRQKLTNIDSHIQKLPCGDKEKMLGNIEELHMTMAELDDRIHELEVSCPTEWSPVREEISGKFGILNDRYEAALHEVVDYDFGG